MDHRYSNSKQSFANRSDRTRFHWGKAETNKKQQEMDFANEINKIIKEDSYLLNDCITGPEIYDNIIRSVNTTWLSDVQSRKITAIVQAYGSGKTKSIIELGIYEAFDLVLPIRFIKNKKLVQSLVNVLNNRLPADEAYPSILAFHNDAVNVFKTWIYSNIQVALCAHQSAVTNIAIKRPLMVYFLTSAHFSDLVESSFAANLLNNKYISDMETIFASKKIAIGFDEIHELITLCRGMFLHDCDLLITSDKYDDVTRFWTNEQVGIKRPGKSNCTDLFYLLRVVLSDLLTKDYPPFATLMTSTVFRTWEDLEVSRSPLSRDTINKISRLPNFKSEDVWITIKHHYCAIPGTQSDYSNLLEKWQGRPYFLFEFLIKQLIDEKPDTVGRVNDLHDICWSKAVLHAKSRIESNADNNLVINDTETAKGYIKLLLYAMQCSNSILKIVDQSAIWKIVSGGYAQLIEEGNGFVIVDNIFKEALLAYTSKLESDYVYDIISTKADGNNLIDSQGHSAKGYVGERLVAQFLKKHFSSIAPNYSHEIVNMATVEEYFGKDYNIELILKNFTLHRHKMIFPGTNLGPDILFVANETTVVAVQVKCEQEYYTWSAFNKALDSLKIHTIFVESSQKYVRILFSFAGFSPSIWFKVSEYNKIYPGFPIILLQAGAIEEVDPQTKGILDKIKLSFNNSNYKLKHEITLFNSTSMTLNKLKRMNLPELEAAASERGIKKLKKRKLQLSTEIYDDMQRWNKKPDEYFSDLILRNKRKIIIN